jgi:hypothetical protein
MPRRGEPGESVGLQEVASISGEPHCGRKPLDWIDDLAGHTKGAAKIRMRRKPIKLLHHDPQN